MQLSTRTSSILGMVLVADAAAFLVAPGAATRLYSIEGAPDWYARFVDYFDEHRQLGRALALAELAFGLAFLRSAEPKTTGGEIRSRVKETLEAVA